jgi:hypothetical protein
MTSPGISHKEIEERGQALLKAQKANEPVENIIAILKSLQEEVVPTEDNLRVCASPPLSPNHESLNLGIWWLIDCFQRKPKSGSL